jgi:ubiquinol-cytochrome c reductase cytochrome b subunit
VKRNTVFWNAIFMGAQVIISLFGSVPLIGHDLLIWILGDYAVGDPALNRFFSLHVIALPLKTAPAMSAM